jgi:hypothetical protein
MATTTPNFGWPVPTSSDLVKNGATAIEGLGDAIDASLLDLKGGTSGQVLAKASGTDMDFSWTTPAAGGGGKVLQVVSAVTTTSTAIASATLADTTITLSITPTSATSKILVMVQANFYIFRSNAASGGKARLLRGATTIVDYPAEAWAYIQAAGATSASIVAIQPIIYLDSPATTSATTYKLQGAATNAADSGSITFQYNSTPSTITLLEIGA